MSMTGTVRENKLCGELVRALRLTLPQFVVFKHADLVTSGIPDISVTGLKRTLWLEVKFANPGVIDRGIQAATMKRLGRAGLAYYVIYSAGYDATYVCSPEQLERFHVNYVQVTRGYDHGAVVAFVKHELESRCSN